MILSPSATVCGRTGLWTSVRMGSIRPRRPPRTQPGGRRLPTHPVAHRDAGPARAAAQAPVAVHVHQGAGSPFPKQSYGPGFQLGPISGSEAEKSAASRVARRLAVVVTASLQDQLPHLPAPILAAIELFSAEKLQLSVGVDIRPLFDSTGSRLVTRQSSLSNLF